MGRLSRFFGIRTREEILSDFEDEIKKTIDREFGKFREELKRSDFEAPMKWDIRMGRHRPKPKHPLEGKSLFYDGEEDENKPPPPDGLFF
jgi:hypothetical protein